MTIVIDPPEAAAGLEADRPDPQTTPADAWAGAGQWPDHPWTGLAVVLAALIMNLLDSTILNVGVPTIQRDLSMSSSAVEWVAAAYTLAIAVGLMTGGRLGDLFGRKRMLLLGLSGFVVASTACAFAWSAESLIVARVLQGLAAALITPQGFGLIRDLFPPQRMTQAFAALGPVIGLSTVAGPIVAGLVLKVDLFGTGWRGLFLINLPLGVFALFVGARVLPDRKTPRDAVRLDVVGTLLLAVVSVLLVFPLVDGRGLGWPLWVFGLLAATVPVLGLFVVHQRARLRVGRAPLVAVSLLRKRSYVSGIVFVLVFFSVVVGFSLTVGLFLQLGLGMTPMHASFVLAACAVGAFIGSGVGAWAATAVGRPILHVGLALMAAATGLLLFSLHGVESAAAVGTGDLVPGLGLFGIGMGMIFVPLFSIIMGEIEDHEMGSASGLLESLQQLGASVGVAVLATLFFSTLSTGTGSGVSAGRQLLAAERSLEVTLGLIALTFAVGWLLPRRARVMY
jgi:EmrB/QacA subfamily drug resistance transporter